VHSFLLVLCSEDLELCGLERAVVMSVWGPWGLAHLPWKADLKEWNLADLSASAASVSLRQRNVSGWKTGGSIARRAENWAQKPVGTLTWKRGRHLGVLRILLCGMIPRKVAMSLDFPQMQMEIKERSQVGGLESCSCGVIVWLVIPTSNLCA
jgi:hypothetical protein